MRVAVCVLNLHIPGPGSLKAKRKIMQSIIKRLRNRFNISVSEIGSHNLWQRSELGIAAVCYNGAGADSIMEKILAFLDQESEVRVIDSQNEIY
ncbi:MAG TPA: DUF503 domain-containing protein [Firmicutes bacterium]|mgnify:CR=1 FL=1|nr:DUF503 domain-containing protein [Bacillota bacterium]